jgi:hypothetical protein
MDRDLRPPGLVQAEAELARVMDDVRTIKRDIARTLVTIDVAHTARLRQVVRSRPR